MGSTATSLGSHESCRGVFEEAVRRTVGRCLPVSAPAPPAVVAHIPHASLVVPSDVAGGLLLTPAELQHELLVMTVRYTDELFALSSSLSATRRAA